MTPKDLLVTAKELVRENWVHRRMASGDLGICNPNDAAATCWCVIGAIYKVHGSHNGCHWDYEDQDEIVQ